MAVPNPIYDLVINGNEELFKGVVAYVEFRTGCEDISNEIAREMRQMGAIVSDKRDNKVTHVIFRNGTLRTSDWAKKHNIPLVGNGWLAACARNKMRFLCTPWREEYIEEKLDACGFRKRSKYKKYIKAMNVEEFEAEMNKSAEKIKKKFNNSLNKSKNNNAEEDAEYVRVMKLSDPCLRPRPPTPEFVKKHLIRHERIRQGGRYSWESSGDEIDDENFSTNRDNDKENSRNLNSSDVSLIEPLLSSPIVTERDFKPIKRSILKKRISNVFPGKSLIFKKLLPKAVQQVVIMAKANEKKRRRQSNESIEPSMKIQKVQDKLSADLLKDISLIKKNNKSMDQMIKTPPIITVNKIPLSPLVTIASVNSNSSLNNFTTPPKSKRQSLRTNVLKNSTKRYYKENENSDDSSDDIDTKTVLVPDTVLINNKPRVYQCNSPPGICTIPETPLQLQNLSGENNGNSFNVSDLQNSSQTSIINEENLTAFNTSKVDSPLLFKRNNVRHSFRISNCFDIADNTKNNNEIETVSNDTKQKQIFGTKKNVRHSLRLVDQLELLDDIIKDNKNKSSKSLTKDTPRVKKNVRHSNRISKLLQNSPEIVISKVSTNENNTTTNPRVEIINEPQIEIFGHRRNLKRQWTAMEEDKKEVAVNKLKPLIKLKKFRDSRDDFNFKPNPILSRRMFSKSLINPICNEIVFVGFEPEESANMKAVCNKMSREFTCVEIISTKEQLIVVSDKPKRSLELIKAFILGNTFVSVEWFHDCVAAKKWLSWSSSIITYSEITQSPLLDNVPTKSSVEHLFNDYTPMYISTNKNSLLPKYKLRLIIEQCGGVVTDSFRQAGLVIDTRKVNAMSVKSCWIIDCVKAGRILDHKKYEIE